MGLAVAPRRRSSHSWPGSACTERCRQGSPRQGYQRCAAWTTRNRGRPRWRCYSRRLCSRRRYERSRSFAVVWIDALRERVPVAAAAALSPIAFAAIHWPYFGLGSLVFVSMRALLPIGLYLRYGDVGASTAMHMLNNAFTYLVVPLFLR
jgi:Type II CAAX prenyl endopeptidase Rce1-like